MNLAKRIIAAVAVAIVVATPEAASGSPPAGLFQITSGTYEVHGGIWGVLSVELPRPDQAFMNLTLTDNDQRAGLTILADDRKTVRFAFTDGVVSDGTIRFHHERPAPDFPGVREERDHVVTFSAAGLTLSGAIQLVPPPCCDIPSYFAHTDVVAARLPEVSIRVSEVEMCWPAGEGFVYQLQSSPSLAAGEWTNVGLPLTGRDGVLCVTEKTPPDARPRFYRLNCVQIPNRAAGHSEGPAP